MMAELSIIAKATVVLAVALLATRAARRASASVRSLILAAAFGLVLVLPIASALAPAREVQIPEVYATRFLIAETTVDQRTDFVDGPPQSAAAPTPAPWRLPPLETLLRMAWLLGAAATLLPLVLGLWRLRDIRRRANAWPEGRALVDVLRESVGVRRAVDVVLHEGVAAPMTCGWMRPTIAMPADAPAWPASDVRQALLHELEHVRRQDWPVHILARLTCSLYWFDPVAWIAWRQLSLDSERACDDAVITQAEHTAYAEQLVSLARRLSKAGAVPLLSMADRRTLSTRIAAILSTTVARGRVGSLAAILVLTGAAALAAAIAPVKAIGAQVRDALTIPTSTDGPTFEVVSVKPNEPDDRLRVNDWQPVTGRLVLRNLTPKVMLTVAYANTATLFLPDERLIGVPDWADKERFTIEAVAGRSVTAAEMQRMLRRVLVDRFGLRVHLEQREQSSYRLVTARPDRRLGPNLKPADADNCKDSRRPRGGTEAWGPQPLICTTIDLLVLDLSERLGRPVLNQTGLTGLYDGTLSYAPSAEELAVIYQLTPSELPPAALAGPSLTTALQEQLGLKLESTRAAIDVLVVDSLDRPTPNDAPELQIETPHVNQTSQPAAQKVRQILSFEVASVKPNVSNSSSSSSDDTPGGYTAINLPLRRLIAFAYRIQPPLDRSQIVAPSWIEGARFDINARAPAGTLRSEIPDMLRALLVERFHLVAHAETKEDSVYALVRARSDSQTGPQLTPSSLDCSTPDSGFSRTGSANAPGAAFASETPRCGMISVSDAAGAVLRGGGRSMTELARNLTGRVNRPVVDQTGLSGIYDFILRWTPDNFQAVADAAGPSRDGTTIFTALQEQLGLKLESQRAPVEFLIIDNVERPTAN